MRIAHLSDLHLCSTRDTIIYGVNPCDNLMRAISFLKTKQDIDLGVITGDVSNDGSPESYLIADELLSQLRFPIFVVNGNHDSASELRKEGYSKIVYNPSFIFGGVHFVALDSVAIADDGTNRSRGKISEHEFARLKDIVEESPKPIIIMMHHPAITTGSWLDRRILEDRERFIEYVSVSEKVIAVLSGHNHFATHESINGCLFNIAPSVSTSFSKNLLPFQEANHPGFDVIAMTQGISVETIEL